jgi:hypothetical protein
VLVGAQRNQNMVHAPYMQGEKESPRTLKSLRQYLYRVVDGSKTKGGIKSVAREA